MHGAIKHLLMILVVASFTHKSHPKPPMVEAVLDSGLLGRLIVESLLTDSEEQKTGLDLI